jgi:hypothetical protein
MPIVTSVLIVLVFAGSVSAQTMTNEQWIAQRYRNWDGPRAMQQLGGVCPANEVWCLGAVSLVQQKTPNEQGGPQGLEGYVEISHDRGDVRLAIGTIGNIEHQGRGRVLQAVPLASGGVLKGEGDVAVWTALSLGKPIAKGTGRIIDYRAIQFDNGLHLRTGVDRDGQPYLGLCPDVATAGPCVIWKP